ncbi:hypothetical protein JXI42_01075 [bacterium]|nr:hypothetical protein [bacterium]
MKPGEFLSDARSWVKGRLPYIRLLLWVYLLYAGIRHISNPLYGSWFDPLNLGIHELGHFVFMPFGKFLEIAGGSILQCLVPIISIFMFYKQKDYFAISVSFGWFSTNLFDVATYIGDARDMELPLVSPFGVEHVIHDWNYLLRKMGIITLDDTIATLVRILGAASMLLCLALGGWLIWLMFTNKPFKHTLEQVN